MVQRSLILASALLFAAAVSSTPRVGVRPGRLFEGTESVALPKGFLLGAGTSAIQSEGAQNEDGRKDSVMDYLMDLDKQQTAELSLPSFPPRGETAGSYRRYKEDVAAAKELKLQVFRISISWPRIFPDGNASNPNPKGVEHYHNFINEIVNAGIQPMVTMYHFDEPLELQKRGVDWSNRKMVDNFVSYADFLFNEYGDKVKLWTTINEPNFYCTRFGVLEVPGYYKPSVGDDYKCIHHTILAHAASYRLYEKKYRKQQGGKIGAAALTLWGRPNTTSWDDIDAAERMNQFGLGAVYHPVVYGEYPPEVRERVDRHSREEGLAQSRLPYFTDAEKAEIAGTADFLCFNAYYGSRVSDGSHMKRPHFGTLETDRDAVEAGVIDEQHRDFRGLFMKPDPFVLWEASKWIYKHYKLPVLITENGWGDERPNSNPIDDEPRMAYHSLYIRELVRAATEGGVEVMGYLVWSLIDSFEWTAGYTRKFGLVHVDYEGGTLKRTLKKSARFFQEVAETRRVPVLTYDYTDDVVPSSGSPLHVVPTTAIILIILLAGKINKYL